MVEQSIIAHQQGKIEELEFQLAVFKGESKARLKACDKLQANLFWCVVNKKFDENLSLAREENPEATETLCWSYAVEWTQEDIATDIGSELESRRQEMIEATNKEHYG